MIDWNGDGKIDPAEIVMTTVLLDDEPPVKKKQPSGCFAACLVVLGLVAFFIVFVFI